MVGGTGLGVSVAVEDGVGGTGDGVGATVAVGVEGTTGDGVADEVALGLATGVRLAIGEAVPEALGVADGVGTAVAGGVVTGAGLPVAIETAVGVGGFGTGSWPQPTAESAATSGSAMGQRMVNGVPFRRPANAPVAPAERTARTRTRR